MSRFLQGLRSVLYSDEDIAPVEELDNTQESDVDTYTTHILQSRKKKTLLIVGSPSSKFDLKSLFLGQKIHGEELQVFQAPWEDIIVEVEHISEPFGYKKPRSFLVTVTESGKNFNIKPDFLLIRNTVSGPFKGRNYESTLYAFMYAGIPCVNSLHSIFCMLRRPVVFSQLIDIREKYGFENFPLIDQNFYASYKSMNFGPNCPAVIKVGDAHAGFGKAIIKDNKQFNDFASILAVTDEYCTVEPFIKGEYDLRIQKIGPHYRAFKRTTVSGEWKTNTGCSILEEIVVTEKYKLWADWAAEMFGGVDILAVDAIHTAEGKEYILEVNDCSIGLGPDHEEEDSGYIRDLVIERMNKLFTPPL